MTQPNATTPSELMDILKKDGCCNGDYCEGDHNEYLFDKITVLISKAHEEGYVARGVIEGKIKATMREVHERELSAERERVMARVESEIRKHGKYMERLIQVIRAKV
jgi:hypothetical protein